MTTPNYSKSEWASLSIQERIRAMNKVAGDDDSLSIAAEEQSVQEERPKLPKRSSVVDIWRKRDGGSGGASVAATKPKPTVRASSPVSVPWPDEEESGGVATATSAHKAPVTSFQQPQKAAVPSWRSQLKSASSSARPAVVENKEADLTILPSTSVEDEEVAAASAAVSSHSKSVMDLFTKKTLTIPDSPMTVATEQGDGDDSVSVTTPKRSSVVDIWTKRSSADTPKTDATPARKSLGSTVKQAAATPTEADSVEKKKESPLKAWNRRKSAPARPAEEEETDLVVVQDDEEEEEIPKETSVLNRYKQLAQLRNVPPPRPTVVETGPSYESAESLEKANKPSSVVSAWGSQLRKVQRNVPSPVTTEPTVDDDEEYTDESAVEEPKSSSVVSRWKPQASGESPQLRKTPTGNVPSPVVMPHSSANTDSDIRSSIASRWNPQGSGASSQVQKANTPAAIAFEPPAEDADGETETAVTEEPKHSCVANRWNPQGSLASPQLRKVPPKVSVVASDTESSALEANDDQEHAPLEEPSRPSITNRWNPQGTLASPQLRKVPPKVPVAIDTESSALNAEGEKDEKPSRPSIANRWNPQGSLASPQLRKVPAKLPPTINTEPSAVNADGEQVTAAPHTPSRSNVANRWNPQGSLASPQLRKVIDKVATPVGAQRPAAPAFDADSDDAKEQDAAESKRPVVVANRWKPQGEAIPQLRSVPAADLETEGPGTVGESDSTPKDASRANSVANRWNPVATTTPGPNKVTTETAPKPKKLSVLDRYKPQASGTPPRKQFREGPTQEELPSAVDQEEPDQYESTTDTSEAEMPQKTKKPSVLDRYKPKVKQSEQDTNAPIWSNRLKSHGSRNAPVVQQNAVATEIEVETSGISASEAKPPSTLDHYKLPSAEKNTVDTKQQTSFNGWSLQSKQTAPVESTQPESNTSDSKETDREAAAEEPAIEPAISLPFDESPTTKLFASIDMSKSSGSVEVELKSGVDKIYDTTDADGFPALSSEEAKEGKSSSEGDASSSVDTREHKAATSEQADESIEKGQEEKPLDPKPISGGAQRSKALELFASRRKYQHVEKVHPSANQNSGKPPLVETPVAKPATASDKTPLDIDTLAENKKNPVEKEKFQSGTSAFTASPKASETPSNSNIVKKTKRSMRPRSMKEFLNKHRKRSSPAVKSSDSVTSRSSVSVGSAGSSEKPLAGKRTDLSVNTADESLDTRPLLPSLAPTDGSAVPESVQAKERKASEGTDQSNTADATGETVDDNEPGRIISNTDTNSTQHEKPISPTIVASPSPRTRTLQERRRGRHKKAIGGSPATPKAQPKSVSTMNAASFVEKRASGDTAHMPNLKPVQERAKAFNHQPSGVPFQSPPTRSWAADKKKVPATSSGPTSNPVASRWPQKDSRTQVTSVDQYAATPATSDAGASDTMTFFSAASSGYSTAISNISVDGSVLSPTSSLSNRASRALVRRRRKQLTKEEEKVAAQDLAKRVTSQTIKEQSTPGFEDEGHPGGTANPGFEDEGHPGGTAYQRPSAGSAEEPFFGQPSVPENDITRGPGLSGRYNTSSRFMDSVQNLMKSSAPNMSFDSGTTEGSSQIRSVGSTSDSEAWMSGRMRKSASSLNRVPSDSTDGVSYQSESVMTNTTGRSKKGGEVVTEYFVSESASNLEALKSAYEAVSLHQIAMDLTDEVSVATSVDLKKIATNLNEGMSAASSSLRSGLNNLNGSRTSSALNKRSRKLKVPKKSSDTRSVDEEVAIEVEYMEDSEEEDGEVSSPDRSRGGVESDARDMPKKPKEESGLPAGEPSQEGSSDRRRAYV